MEQGKQVEAERDHICVLVLVLSVESGPFWTLLLCQMSALYYASPKICSNSDLGELINEEEKENGENTHSVSGLCKLNVQYSEVSFLPPT